MLSSAFKSIGARFCVTLSTVLVETHARWPMHAAYLSLRILLPFMDRTVTDGLTFRVCCLFESECTFNSKFYTPCHILSQLDQWKCIHFWRRQTLKSVGSIGPIFLWRCAWHSRKRHRLPSIVGATQAGLRANILQVQTDLHDAYFTLYIHNIYSDLITVCYSREMERRV